MFGYGRPPNAPIGSGSGKKNDKDEKGLTDQAADKAKEMGEKAKDFGNSLIGGSD